MIVQLIMCVVDVTLMEMVRKIAAIFKLVLLSNCKGLFNYFVI